METCSRNHALPLPELGLAKGSTWVADTDLRLSSAHIEHSSLAIPARTRLRAEQSVSAANVWFRTVLFRLFVLDGPQAGECVWVETDERADLARHSLRRVKTADEYWDMGPGQAGSDRFRCERGSAVAHLYAFADRNDDPDYPRCGVKIRFADTRPAVHGDSRCGDCEGWYEQNVWMPMVG